MALGALLLLVPLAPVRASHTLAPVDYAKVAGLSPVKYSQTIHESAMVPMGDGIELYVETTRPKSSTKFPIIVELSPYHGTLQPRTGPRMLPDDGGLVKYFVPRGYAVLMIDVRGTGRSQGCLDHMGPKDQADAKRVIEWAAARSWSNGRVGLIGHSYPGGTSVMSVAQKPKGLATAIVSAGLGSMYEHQFQMGVPYNAQFLGPIFAYEELAIERHLPIGIPGALFGSGNGGDNFGNDMEYFGCGLTQSSAVAGPDQLSGRFADWHYERDFRSKAAQNKIPVFVLHGVNDNAARVASLDWFMRRKLPTDKLWLGQWDHGSGCCPNRRGWQSTRAIHAWFDKHLQRRDVETGPPVEVFLADGPRDEAIEGARTQIYTATRYPPAANMLDLYPEADGGMGLVLEKTAGSGTFSGDPFGYGDPEFTGAVAFRTRPVSRDLLMIGVPKLTLSASVTVPRVYLIASLYDEAPNGDRRRISQFAINPELRNGIKRADVVVPGEKYVMTPPGFSMAHNLRKGHRLTMRVTTSDRDKLPFFTIDPLITIFTGPGGTALQVPVLGAGRPVLYPDKVSLKRPS